MSIPKLKVALIGCGYIGTRYISVLSGQPYCELAAIIDTDGHRLEAHKDLAIPLFQSAEDFFQSAIPTNAVVIATPNATHAAIATASLLQGKHVLIEKPMALKKSEASKIVKAAFDQQKKVMVALQNRFAPVSIWLKQLVESNSLGKIFFVEVNCFWNRDERYYQKGSWHGTRDMDGGSLFTQFSHFIDMLYWLFGGIQDIRSRFSNFNHEQLIQFEDTGSIHFDFERGGIGSINFTTAVWDQSFESSLTIIAENGSVKISGQYMDKIEYCHIKNYNLPPPGDAVVSRTGNHGKMMDAFVEAIQQDSATNAEDAMHVVDIIERMYAAGDSRVNTSF